MAEVDVSVGSQGTGGPPNWLFFSGVYTAILLAGIAVGFALIVMADIDLPGVLGLAMFYLAVSIAGKRYRDAAKGQWSRQDRHRLAMVYNGASFFISGVGAAILAIFDPSIRDLGGMLGEAWFAVFMVVVLTVLVFVQYGLARWALAQLNKNADRRAAKAEQTAILGKQ